MSKEQRSFFRIDVMLPCSYRILSQEDAASKPLPSNPDASYIEKYFMDNLGELDEQITQLIGQINSRSSVLASVLSAMNSKINFLLQTIDEDQLTHSIPQRMVNLSAGGIAFELHEPVKNSDKVDLLLKPLRDESPILVRCKIVKIVPKDNVNIVAMEFEEISEDDRRKIVYFIQTKEIEMANRRRAEEGR
ncbi:MAG: PilZ domain-containing protein [Thiomicrospira sp.]|jgi:c-di-GMP-binding flagellar brake protein YcgR|nr:PilZ domain-containing protein [Thiomicrospira sp.]